MSSRYTLQIHLPQGVTFSLPLAGPVSRCLAFLIDILLISALTTALERALAPLRMWQEDLGLALVIIFYLAAWLLYGILSEYLWFGQTFGKWLLGLRVVDSAGLELQFHQVAIRNLIRSVDLFPVLGLAGGITMLCNPRLQRLGDLAAGTVVVRNRQPALPDVAPLLRGRYNSFLARQLVCARLRERAPAPAAALAIEALLRRDRLDDRDRVALFDDLAAYFRTLVEFPAEDASELSSEQYVRNIVEILAVSGRQPSLHAAASSTSRPTPEYR
jgi:uncharacterized RDD family membrane protein YckC